MQLTSLLLSPFPPLTNTVSPMGTPQIIPQTLGALTYTNLIGFLENISSPTVRIMSLKSPMVEGFHS